MLHSKRDCMIEGMPTECADSVLLSCAVGAGASLQQQTAAVSCILQQIAQQQHPAGQDGDCSSSAAVAADLAASSSGDTLPAARGDTSGQGSPGGVHLLTSSSSQSSWRLLQPQQQWRCMASLADTLQDFQEQQQQRLHVPQQQQQPPPQPQSQGYGPGQRTEFETRVAACASVSGLAALVSGADGMRQLRQTCGQHNTDGAWAKLEGGHLSDCVQTRRSHPLHRCCSKAQPRHLAARCSADMTALTHPPRRLTCCVLCCSSSPALLLVRLPGPSTSSAS